jgi:hypothetical protein
METTQQRRFRGKRTSDHRKRSGVGSACEGSAGQVGAVAAPVEKSEGDEMLGPPEPICHGVQDPMFGVVGTTDRWWVTLCSALHDEKVTGGARRAAHPVGTQ